MQVSEKTIPTPETTKNIGWRTLWYALRSHYKQGNTFHEKGSTWYGIRIHVTKEAAEASARKWLLRWGYLKECEYLGAFEVDA